MKKHTEVTMSNKHTHSDAAWNIAYEIHSKDAHQWDRAKMNYYRNCERNGAPYPWLTEELDVIENTLLYLGLQDQPDPKLEIEALRVMQQDYATKTADLIIARAKIEKLKKGLNILLSSIEGSLNGIEDAKGDSDVVGISDVKTTLNDLFVIVNNLKIDKK